MRFDLSPWCRARITNTDLARFVRRVPAEFRIGSRLQLGRGRAGWGGRLIVRRQIVAEVYGLAGPVEVLRVLVRQVRPGSRSIAWCSRCEQPAIDESNGEAWCASHRPAQEAAA